MNKIRRIGAMVAATVAATGMAMTVAAAPAQAAPQKGPVPLSNLLAPMVEQNGPQGQWQSVKFRSKTKACNFKMRVWDFAPNATIVHPQGFYTSLWQGPTLNKNEVDFASVKFYTGDYKPGWTVQTFPATIWWDNCKKKAKTQSKSTLFVVWVKGF